MDTPEAGGPPCTTPNIGHHSYPGELLCLKTVDFGDFTWEEVPVTEEDWYDPLTNTYESPGDKNCIKYTFTFDAGECTQEGTETDPIVYWLDVQAFVEEPDIQIGWKTSRSHWNDDATWNQGTDPVTGPWLEMRYPDGHPYSPSSLDLAFEVRTKTSCCVGRVGDANGSGADEPTISDISVGIDALFINGWANSIIVCLEEADINQSGGRNPTQADITIGDLSYLIDYLFITGPPLGLPPCLGK
jgi:hypothetical protein